MIDRKKVVQALEICASREPGGEYICDKCPYETMVDGKGCEVNLTLDAIALLKERKIVRCKDCKYWDSEVHICNIKVGRFACGADWFCADGKRR